MIFTSSLTTLKEAIKKQQVLVSITTKTFEIAEQKGLFLQISSAVNLSFTPEPKLSALLVHLFSWIKEKWHFRGYLISRFNKSTYTRLYEICTSINNRGSKQLQDTVHPSRMCKTHTVEKAITLHKITIYETIQKKKTNCLI